VIQVEKRNLLGVDINVLDYQGAVSKIFECVNAHRRCATTALAVHGLIIGALDRSHRFRLNALDVVVPDGQPVRWAINILYRAGLKDRVYGPQLTLRVCQRAAEQGIPVFFYGSHSIVLKLLCDRLLERFPQIRIAGAKPSIFRQLTYDERAHVIQEIKESGAKILFVGLGCPKQEVFAFEMADHLQIPILAVGAAFNYHAGLTKEPPEFIQNSGLQWLFRLLQEPRRLWRRYLFTNSTFLFLLTLQILKVWKPSASKGTPPSAELLYG
jgi:exopolysaccharide biosynthesis WecB/TagA/CpsF family protein